jgi:geranylgeranyl pyrophosphate synthase
VRQLRATAVLARACGSTGLIGGQVDDLAHEGRRVDAASLERIHRAKTGALLEASVSGGALLGGADADQLRALDGYGRAIGLAFQIVDDLLDATESSEKLGKTAGKDRAAGKATYVSVHGIEAARERASSLLREAVESLTPLGDAGDPLRELARRIVERER